MTEEQDQLRNLYNSVIKSLKYCTEKHVTVTKINNAIKNLKVMDKNPDCDYDREIIALKSGRANYDAVLISIVQKFQIYMRNHMAYDTKRALSVISRDLDKKDYTKNFDPKHYQRAYLESFYYLAPCGDTNSLRDDLHSCNYQNIKADLLVIKSNREDLMKTSHRGNVKAYMGKTEKESVERHNE